MSDQRCSNCGQPYHPGAAPYGCFVNLAVDIDRLKEKVDRLWNFRHGPSEGAPSLVLYDLTAREIDLVFGFAKGIRDARHD